MASSKEYVDYVLESNENLRARPMMGDYVLYYKDRVLGGIYDNQVLITPTASGLAMLEGAEMVSPYPGAKEKLLMESLDDKYFLNTLFEAVYPELPKPKKKK